MLTSQETKSLFLIEEFLKTNAPHFPITPTIAIQVAGFGTVYIKDESQNPTGTHKDRMAREIVNTYREMLLTKKEGHHNHSLPVFSIISAGSAAFAIQTQLQKFHLPALHILVDTDTSPHIIDMLKNKGGKVYMHHFDHKALSGEDILKLTENNNGFDITSNKAFDSGVRFYDRLSYEVLNYCPDIVFVPYGTGQLFENLIQVNKKIVANEHRDPVCTIDTTRAKNICFYGATTNDHLSKAIKLYAPFRPFTTSSPQWVKLQALKGYCHIDSSIDELHESYLSQAMQLFQDYNIQAERSGVAGMALFLEMMSQLDPSKKILIINTGKSVCS